MNTERALKELELRRRQMDRMPFCSDHRDKVFGLDCRECEIEWLRRLLRRAASQNETEIMGDSHNVRDNEIAALRAMVDRAHDALNELLAEHLNVASDAARIARRGLFTELPNTK